MKRLLLLIALICIFGGSVFAQHFEKYYKFDLDSLESYYCYHKTGLKVVDENGNEIRRTEPLYIDVAYKTGAEQVAVCISLYSFGKDEKNYWGKVWVCLDINLCPVFFFPSKTERVTTFADGLFLYSDMPSHYSSYGLINKHGEVVFESSYQRIVLGKNHLIGLKDVTGINDNSGIKKWDVVFKALSSDTVFEIRLQTPEGYSWGLFYEDDYEDPDEIEWLNNQIKDDSFQRGLNHIIHSRKNEAIECFRDALESSDSKIVKCANYNISALESFLL